MSQEPATPLLRIATPGDAAAISAIYAPYVSGSVISFEQDPPDAEDMGRRMEAGDGRFPWLVYAAQGALAGYAYAGPHHERAAYRWSANVSVYVAEGFHRRGVGRSLYGRLLAILALQGFHMAFAGITLPNAASVGLHEAFGFRPIGVYSEAGFKFGAWRDVGWWGRSLNPPAADPAPPKPFSPGLFEDSALRFEAPAEAGQAPS